MRKKINLLLAICLLLALLCSCGDKSATGNTKPNNTPQENQNPDATDKTPEQEPTAPVFDSAFLKKEEELDSRISLSSADPTDCVFRLGNSTYRLPFSYGRISDKWTFDPTDYDIPEDFLLAPGQRTSDNIILKNKKTDYSITVGLYNPYEVPISLGNSKVWSITVSIDNAESTPYLRLPRLLSFKSDFVDVIKTYSDPSIHFTHDIENKLYHYTYHSSYERYLLLDISEDRGIVSFTMKRYD